MKIYELLCEQNTADNITNELLANCSPFLKQIDYNIVQYPLYRGFFHDQSAASLSNELIKQPGFTENRVPTGNDQEIHDGVNAVFVKLFHFPFRNGTFVSSNLKDARCYGNVSLIAPIGEFHFLWSKEVHDLYHSYKMFIREYINAKGPAPRNDLGLLDRLYLKHIADNEFHFQTTDLKGAIMSGNEIMIYCNEYYKIPMKNEHMIAALKQIHNRGTSL